jgi:hypothetical protein
MTWTRQPCEPTLTRARASGGAKRSTRLPRRTAAAVGARFTPSIDRRPPANATPTSASGKASACPHHQRPAKPGPQFFSAYARAPSSRSRLPSTHASPLTAAVSMTGCQYWASPGTRCPNPDAPSAPRGHVTRGSSRASIQESSSIRTRNSSSDPRNESPARAPKPSGSPVAGSNVAWRTKPPGWAASATVAHDPPDPRHTPQSQTTTHPASGWTRRQ